MDRRNFIKMTGVGLACSVFAGKSVFAGAGKARPNIVLVMADDQGWGEMSYYNHPVLKTPNLDEMAKNGLRFDRFYAGAPVCSPTRASVLTGRTPVRTGVPSHGHALRKQEKTLPQALKDAGYATGHFGKWHLNGKRGAGVPVLSSDPYHPGHFGFEEWLSVTNFFDLDPLMGRNGKIEQMKGDSSDIIVAEALKFIKSKANDDKPFFTVIWYGSPHSGFHALPKDREKYSELPAAQPGFFGELCALDRSVGALRKGLRDMGAADNTIVWYCSDNGGLRVGGEEASVGGLRGKKGSVWEGGLRVPCIIEWPAEINPRITKYPAVTMDIMPTIMDILGLPDDTMMKPCDGRSIKQLLKKEMGKRDKPIPFFHEGRSAALIDNDYKIVKLNVAKAEYQLFDLVKDKTESNDIYNDYPEIAKKMTKQIDAMLASVQRSVEGKDYPEGKLTTPDPERVFWKDVSEYQRFLKSPSGKKK